MSLDGEITGSGRGDICVAELLPDSLYGLMQLLCGELRVWLLV